MSENIKSFISWTILLICIIFSIGCWIDCGYRYLAKEYSEEIATNVAQWAIWHGHPSNILVFDSYDRAYEINYYERRDGLRTVTIISGGPDRILYTQDDVVIIKKGRGLVVPDENNVNN